MKKTAADFRAVILAGGGGERFWPLSTPERPKQFLDIFGGESLIRQTVKRLLPIVPAEKMFVVTSRNLAAATRRELPVLPQENTVGEPQRRDTGAAVALGVALAAPVAAAGDPVIGFFPSDQTAASPGKFRRAVSKAVSIAAKSGSIVVIGIKPSEPSTAYGYINPATGKFAEKPPPRKAAEYVRRGYLWNAGMFIARSSVFRAALGRHAPELASLSRLSSPRRGLAKAYARLPRISFDYAVMEKMDGIRAVEGDFGWDDVGGYGAFDRHFPHDASGNVRDGNCSLLDSSGNICISRAPRISLLGVKDLVVVATKDEVLVAGKSAISGLKRLLAK